MHSVLEKNKTLLNKAVHQFVIAASNGDNKTLNQFLDVLKIDVNSQDPELDGKTALEVAAENGYLETVKLLLHRGATAPCQHEYKLERIFDDSFWPPMQYNKVIIAHPAILAAAKNGHGDVARALLFYKKKPKSFFDTWMPNLRLQQEVNKNSVIQMINTTNMTFASPPSQDEIQRRIKAVADLFSSSPAINVNELGSEYLYNLPILDLGRRDNRNIDYIKFKEMAYPIMRGVDLTGRPFISFKTEDNTREAKVSTHFYTGMFEKEGWRTVGYSGFNILSRLEEDSKAFYSRRTDASSPAALSEPLMLCPDPRTMGLK